MVLVIRRVNKCDMILEATTRNGSCIDGVFSRGFSALQTQNYISYFSHLRPLLSITDVKSKELNK
jgi:hypothetical protein